MQVLEKIVFSPTEPPSTNCLWIKPVKGGVALYHFEGYWKVLRLMDDHGTLNPIDDTPIDVSGGGGQLGPDTVGTEQIIDNSVEMQDLNDSVKDKIQKTYYQEDESLHMDYDIATQTGFDSGAEDGNDDI
jgi:hypothetical protein